MTQYKCGHESKIIIVDCGALSIAAYLEWSETVGVEGTKEKCWACWCKEGKNLNNSQSSTPKLEVDV